MPALPTSPDFNRSPILWLSVSFACGILFASLINIDLRLTILNCAIFAISAIVLRRQNLATFLILIAFASAGAVSFEVEKLSISPDRIRVLYDNETVRSGDSVEVEGVLLGRPEPSIDGLFLTLRTEKLVYQGTSRDVSGSIRLFLPESDDGIEATVQISEFPELKYGSRLRIACKLVREEAFLNPGVISKKEILDRLQVDATGSIKSRLLVERVADESVFLPLAWVYDRRAALIEDFRNNLSPTSAGIMIASLLGDKYFLDKDTADLFRDGGTFHILVISGLHVTFIGGLLLLFLRHLTRNRWTQFGVTTIALWAYTLAVGADVPVVRAAIMFTIISFSFVIYRQGSLLNSLGVCGLMILVWRPSDLFNPSFQLTFVSVAAIVAMTYPLIETLRKIGRWAPTAQAPFPPNVPNWLRRFCETLYWREDAWKVESKQQIWTAKLFKAPYWPNRAIGVIQNAARFVFEGVIVSLIVQVWMLPLTVVYFHRVSVASILLNLWVGFFIALESFAAVAGVLAGHISGLLADPLFMFADGLNWLMLSVPRLFSDNGLASFRLPAYSADGRAIYIAYFVPVLFLVLAANRWKPFEIKWPDRLVRSRFVVGCSVALAMLICVIVFHPFSVPRADGRLHVDFLDVGQGDAALVTFPDGQTLLVDGGGRIKFKADDDVNETFEPDVRGIGEAVVSEFLWNRGYSRIDHILATHADADHIQGLTDVAKNFSIGSAAFGRTPMDDPDFAELADVLQRRGIHTELLARGDHFEYGGVRVEVLYPIASDDPNALSDNDHSVVLRIVYGTRVFLLTGDIERTAETALVTNGGTLAADVVKVAHHGSRTSSMQQFIDATGAKYAVISVGRSSPFGHPHVEVVERWQAAGTEVFTTGQNGMISVSTDGKDLKIDQFH